MELLAEIIRWVPAMKILSLALAAVFFAFGIAKFARYEQDAVKTLVAGHPVLRFGPKLMTSAGFSIFLGTGQKSKGANAAKVVAVDAVIGQAMRLAASR